MEHIIIGTSKYPNSYYDQISRALGQTSADSSHYQSITLDKEWHVSRVVAVSESINQKAGNALIIIDEEMPEYTLKQLLVLTKHLKKPYNIVFEQVKKPANSDEKAMLSAISRRASSRFVVQKHILDTLSHHYQIDTESFVLLGYGHWLHTPTDAIRQSSNMVAIIVDKNTIVGLESMIKVASKMKGVNNSLKFHIICEDDCLKGGNWGIRNQIMINRLGLDEEVEWLILTDSFVSVQADRYKMLIFAFSQSNNDGGNRCLRHELMSMGNIIVSYNDHFASEQLTDNRAFLIQPEQIENLGDTMSHWISNQHLQNEVRSATNLSTYGNDWESIVLKIGEHIELQTQSTASKSNQAHTPWIVSDSVCNNPFHDVEIQSRILTELSHEIMWIYFIHNNRSQECHEKSLSALMNSIARRHEYSYVNPKNMFATAHTLYHLSKDSEMRLSGITDMLIKRIAPTIAEDYHQIELHYYLHNYLQKPATKELERIKQRTEYLLEISVEWSKRKVKTSYLNQVKAIVTLFEAASVLKDNTLTDQANELLQNLESELFNQNIYRPGSRIDTADMVRFNYWLLLCYRASYSINPNALVRAEQVWAWYFGYNEKNIMWFDTGSSLSFSGKERQFRQAERSVEEILFFLLSGNTLVDMTVESYYR